MGSCVDCVYFRRVKPASQLLASVIATTDAAVSNALTKVVEDEQKQRDAEAEFKKSQAMGDNDLWAARPVMSDYCGLGEEANTFRIAEVKNFGGRCEDFKKEERTRHACATCIFRAAATGPDEDLAMEKSFTGMATSSIIAGLQPGNADSLLNKYREGVASRKGFELSGIYAANGVLATRPKYFDYCSTKSREDEFVICVLANPYHTCSLWKQAEAPVVAANAAPAMSSASVACAAPTASTEATELFAPVPLQPTHPTVWPVAPKVRVGPALGLTRLPDADDVIVPGDPPLTRGLLEDVCDFMEWILDVHLSWENQFLLSYLKKKWRQNDRAEIVGCVRVG